MNLAPFLKKTDPFKCVGNKFTQVAVVRRQLKQWSESLLQVQIHSIGRWD